MFSLKMKVAILSIVIAVAASDLECELCILRSGKERGEPYRAQLKPPPCIPMFSIGACRHPHGYPTDPANVIVFSVHRHAIKYRGLAQVARIRGRTG